MPKRSIAQEQAADTLYSLGFMARSCADESTSETYKPVFSTAARALHKLAESASANDPHPVLDDGIRRTFYLRSIVEPVAAAVKFAEHDGDAYSAKRLGQLERALRGMDVADAVRTLRSPSATP